MKFDLEKEKLLVLLLATDLAFIILYIIHTYTSLLPSELYSISLDRGYAEFFLYMKEFWILILFLFLGIKKRSLIFIVFAFLFLYILVDDSFEFHERLGNSLAYHNNFPELFGLRPKDLGELLVFATFGGFFLVLIGITYFRSDVYSRTVTKYLLFMLVLLGLCGVVFDMIGIIADHPVFNPILTILEDGGEMVVISLIAWFVFRLNIHAEKIPLVLQNASQQISNLYKPGKDGRLPQPSSLAEKED